MHGNLRPPLDSQPRQGTFGWERLSCFLNIKHRTNITQIHPVHKAYLHFYPALSHEAMARETVLKHRSSELDLAEKHYRAAIDALSPEGPYDLDDILSPSSPKYEYEHVQVMTSTCQFNYPRGSRASSTSSFTESDHGDRIATPRKVIFAIPSTTTPPPTPPPGLSTGRRRPTPISTMDAVQAYHEQRFSADLLSFLDMLQTHLRSVQELKASLPTNRSLSLPKSSTSTLRSSDHSSVYEYEDERQQLHWVRKTVQLSFRPRFNPESVRRLCSEALADL